MNSQVTLVTPAPPTSYYLSATDPRDIVVYAQPSVPIYHVISDARKMVIRDASDSIIAILHRRDLFSDTLSFPQRCLDGDRRTTKNVNVQRWLKRSKNIRDGIPTFTFDTDYGPCVWKMISRSHTMIFPDYDLERPVATCYFSRSKTEKPAFVIQSDGEPVRDDIVVAYFVQRHRIMLEKKALNLLVGPN